MKNVIRFHEDVNCKGPILFQKVKAFTCQGGQYLKSGVLNHNDCTSRAVMALSKLTEEQVLNDLWDKPKGWDKLPINYHHHHQQYLYQQYLIITSLATKATPSEPSSPAADSLSSVVTPMSTGTGTSFVHGRPRNVRITLMEWRYSYIPEMEKIHKTLVL